MRKIAALPSLVTLGNLVCGFQAIRFASDGQLEKAAWMVLLGMVFDALDGKVARLTKGSSEFGAELDSLADVVTFGVAPAFLVATLATQMGLAHPRLVGLSCMVYTVCTALRLARFNVTSTLDESSHQFFRGLPSPAAAGQVVSLIILHLHLVEKHNLVVVHRVVPAVTFFAGILMVSRIRYPHLVSRLVGGKRAFSDFMFLVIVALLLVYLSEITLAAGFTLFTVSGIALAVRHALSHKAEEQEPIF